MILVETDRIILSCDTTGFTMAVSYENCSAFTNTSASTTAMWAATTSETTSATDELLVVYYDWEIDDNTGAEREGIITYAYTDDDGNQYSIDIPIKQGTGISYSAPIWKDVYYTASTSPFEYSIRYNGVDVYYGKAYAKPSESGVRVKVNTICSNYIRMRLDDMRQYEDDVVGNEAFGAFDLCDSDGVSLMRYKFLMDWSGEWSGQSPYVMTDLINGHIDPRMKMLFTVYCDNVTELDWTANYYTPFTITPDTLNFPMYKTDNIGKAVTITSKDSNWTITDYPDWASVSTTSGTVGDTTIRVNADSYTSGTQRLRSGRITLTDGEYTDYIYINQQYGRVIVKPDPIMFFANASSKELTIDAGGRWNISKGEEDWFDFSSTSGNGHSVINVSVSANTGSSRTSSYVVTDTEYLPYTGVVTQSTYSPTPPTPPTPTGSSDYFAFEILTGGTINWIPAYGGVSPDAQGVLTNKRPLQYKINNGEWLTMPLVYENESQPITINVSTGDVVKFKGDFEDRDLDNYTFSGTTAYFNVRGNIMSLIYGDSYTVDFTYRYRNQSPFICLFENTNVVSASELILPNNTLKGCYYGLFFNCKHLQTPPVLPATTLTEDCYAGMFSGCESLTIAPALPATVLAVNCYGASGAYDTYGGMFAGCTSLTIAPALPATTLASNCYSEIFSGCTALTTAPELPATTLADGCYSGMFKGCISLTTAPELPATTLTEWCYSAMFRGCTALTTAPELPASYIPHMSYNHMFMNCTLLNYVKCLATSLETTSWPSTEYWLYGVSETGTFVKASSMSGWTRNSNGIPSGWTIINDE